MATNTMTTARAAAMAMITLAAAASAASAQELLLNPGFEDGPIDFGAPNWLSYGNVFTVGEYAHNEAGKSLKAFAPYTQYAGSVAIQERIAATVGSQYKLTGFIYNPTADAISPTDFGLLELSFRDAANVLIGTPIGQHLESTSPKDTWNPYTINATAPAGTAFVQVVIGYIQLSAINPTGAVFFDDLSLTKVVAPTESIWIATGSGGWLSGSNWQNGTVPNAVGAVANFNTSITAPATVTIAGAGATAGTVRFNNGANAYTVAGPGTLTLDVATGTAALAVTAGNHAINAPLALNDSTIATIAAGQSLSIGGPLTLNNGAQLASAGAGTLTIASTSVTGSTGASVRANGGIVQANVDLSTGVSAIADAGELRFNATQHLRSLALSGTAKVSVPDAAAARVVRTNALTLSTTSTLELGDNALIVDYTGASPAAAVRAAIVAGKAGSFAGTGLISTKAAADARYTIGYGEASAIGSPTSYLGETGLDATTLLVRVTLAGDADLNGNVSFDDLLSLAKNYGQSGKVWTDGDFDYTGSVAFDDLLALAKNYGGAASAAQLASLDSDFASDFALAQSLVPEPTALIASLGAAAMFWRRRR